MISSSIGFSSIKKSRVQTNVSTGVFECQKTCKNDVLSQLNVNSEKSQILNISLKKGNVIFNNCSFVVRNLNTK